MKNRVAIRDILNARKKLVAAGSQVSVSNIASCIETNPRNLASKFAHGLSWLAKEIQVEKGSRWNTKAIHELYVTTAEYIREQGGVPSCRSIALALKKPESTVYVYLRAHPGLSARIGLVSDEYERYYAAYRTLIRRGMALGRKQLAASAKVHRDTLARFLKREPGFLSECPLKEDKRWVKRRAATAR